MPRAGFGRTPNGATQRDKGDDQSVRSLFRRIFTQQPLAAKVPEITVMFWVVKILTTASGEAISDYLSTRKQLHGRFRR